MYTSTPSVVIAANVRPGLIGSESTPPWPKIHGFSINTTSWPASGEYTLQPTSPNAINIVRYFIDLPQAMVDHQSTIPQAGTPAEGGQVGPSDRPAGTTKSAWGLVERKGIQLACT